MSEKLLPCPCGKVPDHLSLSDNGQSGKWAQATCPDCGEWSIEFRTDYKPLSECQGRALEAWNAAPRAQPEVAQAGWQPIAVAPKDGNDVLVYFDDGVVQMMGWDGTWNHAFYPPTHWMPLPDPPAALDRARKGGE